METRDKLQKLEASAGLVEKRTLFEAAAAWAMVRDRMDLLARQKELAEVRAACWQVVVAALVCVSWAERSCQQAWASGQADDGRRRSSDAWLLSRRAAGVACCR